LKSEVKCDRLKGHGGEHRAGSPTHVTHTWDSYQPDKLIAEAGAVQVFEKASPIAGSLEAVFQKERDTKVEHPLCDSYTPIPGDELGTVVRCSRIKGHDGTHENGHRIWTKGIS